MKAIGNLIFMMKSKIPVGTSLVLLPTLFLLALTGPIKADVKPHPLFTDGAVLQQGVDIPVWGTAKDGERVTVTLDGQSASTVAREGKWIVRLAPRTAGGPFTMTVAGRNTVTIQNVAVGEVWVCAGQSNMEWTLARSTSAATEPPKANHPMLRMFTVKRRVAIEPASELAGSWVVAAPATVPHFSAVGYFFARDIHKELGVPVGMLNASWSGTPAQAWTSFSGLKKDPELEVYLQAIQKLRDDYPLAARKYPELKKEFETRRIQWQREYGNPLNEAVKAWQQERTVAIAEGRQPGPYPTAPVKPPVAPAPPEGDQTTPTTLFNAMVAPLMPYAIRGVIWYQGEANANEAKRYQTLFPRLIADWREKWGSGDFPFLFVQIAPFKGRPPYLMEAQLLSLGKVKNTAMVVTADVGDPEDNHPRNKEPVGGRLALAARGLAYREDIVYSGPIFENVKFQGNKAVLGFKHVGGGLVAKDGELKGFAIAGADKNFVPAWAEIKGEKVVVASEKVTAPVAVRYGWANVPDVSLYNKEGLPAPPFRSDAE
jgi:sialate O-acetylesterase